jgi:hypothetical protein
MKVVFFSALLAGAYAADNDFGIGRPMIPGDTAGPRLLSSLDVTMQEESNPKDISGPGFIRAMYNPRNRTYDLMISSFGMFQKVRSHSRCSPGSFLGRIARNQKYRRSDQFLWRDDLE